jgi:hypothetical protein
MARFKPDPPDVLICTILCAACAILTIPESLELRKSFRSWALFATRAVLGSGHRTPPGVCKTRVGGVRRTGHV